DYYCSSYIGGNIWVF
nr:immunoglobulin light chain junction region [Macaca mulatta]MOY09208.1 immunoglobulin light chain junction region [Macaca mulatta]